MPDPAKPKPDVQDREDVKALKAHIQRQQQINAGHHERAQRRGIPRDRWLYLSPLILAPALPLIRIGLRRNPVLRDRVFFGAITVGVVHGVALATGWWKKVLDGDTR